MQCVDCADAGAAAAASNRDVHHTGITLVRHESLLRMRCDAESVLSWQNV